MYNADMIRTQIYMPKDTHEQLIRLARARKEAVAKLVRDFVKAGLAKTRMDQSGIKTLNTIAHLKLKGGPKDLSENFDHYLYGKPRK